MVKQELFDLMQGSLDHAEFVMLCFNLDINHQILPGKGEGLPMLLMSLIEHCRSRGLYDRLVEEFLALRPHLAARREPAAPVAAVKPPLRAQVRELLKQVLPTNAELDAFCLDYFPATYRRFSNGMDRTQKETLLLESMEPQAVLTCLRQHAPALAAKA